MFINAMPFLKNALAHTRSRAVGVDPLKQASANVVLEHCPIPKYLERPVMYALPSAGCKLHVKPAKDCRALSLRAASHSSLKPYHASLVRVFISFFHTSSSARCAPYTVFSPRPLAPRGAGPGPSGNKSSSELRGPNACTARGGRLSNAACAPERCATCERHGTLCKAECASRGRW